jgi:hypothetical protein
MDSRAQMTSEQATQGVCHDRIAGVMSRRVRSSREEERACSKPCLSVKLGSSDDPVPGSEVPDIRMFPFSLLPTCLRYGHPLLRF